METERWLFDSDALGRCPACEATIPTDRLLAAYVTDGEWPRMLAECSDCAAVVAPT